MRTASKLTLWLPLLWSLVAGHGSLLSATTLSGTVKRPDGSPVTGTIEFLLSQPAKTTTPPIIFVPAKTTCAVTAGLIASGCAVQGNDTLDPAGTFYRVRVVDSNNLVVLPSANYTLTGAAVDLSELPVTASDTLVPPTGAVTGNLNVTGNLTVGGSAAFGADPQDFAHLRLLGQSADPATQSNGSLFFRSDLDRFRFRAGGLEVFDGASYLPLTTPSAGTIDMGANFQVGTTREATFKRLNKIRLVDPNLWTETGVTAKIDAAISDCSSAVCLVVLPSNLGAGEATALPDNATLLDLRQTVTASPTAGAVPGLLLRRRLTAPPGVNFRNLVGLYLDVDAADGGQYNSTSKNMYAPLYLNHQGRTQGEHHLIRGRLDAYGIGDAVFLGGTVTGYGARNVSGTSQPATQFAEININQGATVFTAQVSGDPATGATTISYTSDTNESVLGERALLNTSRTTTSGTVTGIAGDTVTFSGAPDWTTLSPSPVGQYFKINSEDVTLGGVSTGHWYRVLAAPSATTLQLEVAYDTVNLASTGAYTLAQGAEIQSFDTAANMLAIESNSYDWAAGDNLLSPPMPLLNFRGLNLFLTKQFKTGTSRALDITNTGPFPWDIGLLIEGAPAGANAFRDGIVVSAKVDDAIDLSAATVASAALRLPVSKPIRWGTDADFSSDGSLFSFNKRVTITSAGAATPILRLQHAASPTADHLLVVSSAGATIFQSDPNGVVNLKPAFGTGLKLDPNTGPTLAAIGGNTNIVLDLITKGTGAVRVNAQASTGSGGFAVYDGAATPSKVFSVTATGLGPNDRGLKHARVTTGSIPGSSSAAVTLTWGAAFPDANYTVNCSLVEATASTSTLRLHHLESVSASAVIVRVSNDDPSTAKTGTLHCTALHD